jgi:serine phosphatase RsbU (regulator of sigma subunit)
MEQINNKAIHHDWPEASLFKKSIRFEFSLYVSAIMIVLMLITGYVVSNQFVETVTRDVAERLLVQARSYTASAGKSINSAAGPDILLLSDLCRKLSDNDKSIFWVGIAGTEGRYIAHTNLTMVVSSQSLSTIQTDRFSSLLKQGEAFSFRKDTLQIYVPIVDNGETLGHLAVAASPLQIYQARKISIITVASITTLMILIGIPLLTGILSKKLRPIIQITEHLKKINIENIELDLSIQSQNEVGYLARTLEVMGSKLNTARAEMIEKERMSRELEIAREIQASILPLQYPSATEFQFAGVYRSAKEVGGDYYDFIDLGSNQLAFLVADVSGKSLPGMLVMLMVRDIIKRFAPTAKDPADLLCQVNRELLQVIRKGMFVTMYYGVLNKNSGELNFASAGHNPLILFRESGDKPEIIRTKGYPLGIMLPGPFAQRMESKKLVLSKNDWVIQYTDGVNEAHNLADEEYGIDRLLETVHKAKTLSPLSLVDFLLARQMEFVGAATQYDDITLVALKWTGKVTDNDKENDYKMGIVNASQV